MNQTYKVINLQYAVPPSLPIYSWGCLNFTLRYSCFTLRSKWGDLEGLSVDPLQFKYPELTPFQYASNRCVTGIDMDGLEYISADNTGVNIESIKPSLNDGKSYLQLGDKKIEILGNFEFNGKNYYNIGKNLYYGENGWSTNGSNEQLMTQMFITSTELKSIFPNGKGLDTLSNILNSNLFDFEIKTPEALAHFLSQAGEETGGFSKTSVTENLNYSAKRLVQVWPSRFSLTPIKGKELASNYANNPEKLGNFVYANRMGNGDVSSGDGYLYRGRGVFQLTGKNNYTNFQTYYNAYYSPSLDILNNPELVGSDTNIAVISALWYFNKKVLNKINIQNATVSQVTKKVNGGSLGLVGRTSYYNTAINILKKK
ncbi:MAG: hypothetical protein PHC83_05140 [Bacteroidales bacterium]|nr:hypothetical protein [Bacteroidales bacterium]